MLSAVESGTHAFESSPNLCFVIENLSGDHVHRLQVKVALGGINLWRMAQ